MVEINEQKNSIEVEAKLDKSGGEVKTKVGGKEGIKNAQNIITAVAFVFIIGLGYFTINFLKNIFKIVDKGQDISQNIMYIILGILGLIAIIFLVIWFCLDKLTSTEPR